MERFSGMGTLEWNTKRACQLVFIGHGHLRMLKETMEFMSSDVSPAVIAFIVQILRSCDLQTCVYMHTKLDQAPAMTF